MQIIETPLKDCFIIKNTIFPDGRGYFFESFNHKKFAELTGWKNEFVQDNQSQSGYGVVRGIHLQKAEHAQSKLVRVLLGKVLDVAVDLRTESPTFGQSFTIELSDDNEFQFFVPRGFGHGFSVLSETAIFSYKCDNYYNKASEGSIHPYDADLNINWKIPFEKAVLSEKDKVAGNFKTFLESIK